MLLLRLLSAFAGLTGVAAREYYGTYIGKFQNRQDIQSKDYFVDVKTFAGSHSARVVSHKRFFLNILSILRVIFVTRYVSLLIRLELIRLRNSYNMLTMG